MVSNNMIIDPSGKYIYIINQNQPYTITLSMFSINGSTGQLSSLGESISLTNNELCTADDIFPTLAIDPAGKTLSVSLDCNEAVYMFNINQNNGLLIQQTTATNFFQTYSEGDYGPAKLTIDPSGLFGYALGDKTVGLSCATPTDPNVFRNCNGVILGQFTIVETGNSNLRPDFTVIN